MLESQNVKASYHPMSIRFFFINSTPICRGGGVVSWLLYNWWCPCSIAHGIQPRQWGATRGHWVAGQERDLAAFLCPLNFTFPLHSCLKGKAILWLEDKIHCAKDSSGGQMLITPWALCQPGPFPGFLLDEKNRIPPFCFSHCSLNLLFLVMECNF